MPANVLNADAWIIKDRRLYRTLWMLHVDAPEPPIDVVRYYAGQLLDGRDWHVEHAEHIDAYDVTVGPRLCRIDQRVALVNVDIVRICLEEFARELARADASERATRYGTAFRHIASIVDRVIADAHDGRETLLAVDHAMPQGILMREPRTDGVAGDQLTMNPADAVQLRRAVLRRESFQAIPPANHRRILTP